MRNMGALSEGRFRLNYDRSLTGTYGYWSHDCGGSWYGGGEARHAKTCSATGYEDCTYHFGPEEVKAVKIAAARRGTKTAQGPNSPLSLELLHSRQLELAEQGCPLPQL